LKAVVITQYGAPTDVLKLAEVDTPLPAEDELLIKIYASSVNPLDSFIVKGPLFFLPLLGRRLKPKRKIAGTDLAGRVESVGRNIKRFQPGDEIFGTSLSEKGLGSFAEFACASENSLAPKPNNLTFELAAAIPVAALTALQGLRDHGHIKPGQKVLIDGASGGVGTYAIQIAKSFEAEVTAVCSPRNIDQARLLGADQLIDYTQQDFTRNGLRYDLILGANAHHSIFRYRRSLTPDGIFVMIGGSMARILQSLVLCPLLSRMGRKKMRFFVAKVNTTDLSLLKDLCEAGKMVSIIDRQYPLAEVAEALRYRDEGHAQGKVVIIIHHDDDVRTPFMLN
jgi:NADPH:quinone reductase-like Zn-dependent oxidoreductase